MFSLNWLTITSLACAPTREYFFYPHLRRFFFHCFRRERKGETERETEGEKETSMWERTREYQFLLPSCRCLEWGSNLQPGCVPWLRIKPMTLWSMGQCSNQLSHAGQGFPRTLLIPSFLCFLKSHSHANDITINPVFHYLVTVRHGCLNC